MTINQPTGSWVQDYGYDSGERLSSIQAPSGTFGYVYPNGSGTLRSSSWLWERLDLPGGHDINRSFDGLARLTQTELQDDANTALNRHDYQFNSRHQRSRQTFLAGNYVDYTYDDNGQLTSAIAVAPGVSPQKSNLRYRIRRTGLSQREVTEHLGVAIGVAISAGLVEVQNLVEAQNRLPSVSAQNT